LKGHRRMSAIIALSGLLGAKCSTPGFPGYTFSLTADPRSVSLLPGAEIGQF